MPVLMEFTWPKASPALAGVKREIIYRIARVPKVGETSTARNPEKENRPWWESLLPLLGTIIVIWILKRKG